MRTIIHEPTVVGDLVVAAFDVAALYSTDEREVSRLATDAVTHMLERAQKPKPSHAPRRLSSDRRPS
jgi:hypothetical protein